MDDVLTLRQLPGNDICADCDRPGTPRSPPLLSTPHPYRLPPAASLPPRARQMGVHPLRRPGLLLLRRRPPQAGQPHLIHPQPDTGQVDAARHQAGANGGRQHPHQRAARSKAAERRAPRRAGDQRRDGAVRAAQVCGAPLVERGARRCGGDAAGRPRRR